MKKISNLGKVSLMFLTGAEFRKYVKHTLTEEPSQICLGPSFGFA